MSLIFTTDCHLYIVYCNIIWSTPEDFGNFLGRLGDMHRLMSFIGCVGTFMANRGLAEIMEVFFVGDLEMLTGKKGRQYVTNSVSAYTH